MVILGPSTIPTVSDLQSGIEAYRGIREELERAVLLGPYRKPADATAAGSELL